ADVELPAVPGAAQELALARHAIVAWPVGLHEADHPALAQLRALVRAAVGEGVVLSAHIEEPDLAPHRFHDLGSAGLDLARLVQDAAAYFSPYNARALSPKSMVFCLAFSFSLANTCAGSSKSQCG